MQVMKKRISQLLKNLMVLSLLFLSVACSGQDFYLLGQSEMTLEVHSKYEEPGYFIKDNQFVSVEGNLDTDHLGKYTLVYTAGIGNTKKVLIRTINIVDTSAPILTLTGSLDRLACEKDAYNEEGFSAFDNTDGDISDQVIIDKRNSGYHYSVKDSSGNFTEATRMFTKTDTLSPTLTLIGLSSIKVSLNSTYHESGFIVSDNCAIDENQVIITNSINVNTLGQYVVTYSITDQAGNNTTLKRNVEVAVLPQTTVYLTFDDGPSLLTMQVLDILKAYDVKATFFVIKQKAALEPILLRAFQEGNTVALHSDQHVYTTIYASSNNFYTDLESIQNWVENLTGNHSMIYRFPGGSSNTKSDFNPGIMSTLTKSVESKDFHYFDWNVSSGDGYSKTTTDQIINNVTKNIRVGKSYVVLMHDSSGHEATIAALPNILEYLQSIGAVILPITMETPVVHHNVQN